MGTLPHTHREEPGAVRTAAERCQGGERRPSWHSRPSGGRVGQKDPTCELGATSAPAPRLGELTVCYSTDGCEHRLRTLGRARWGEFLTKHNLSLHQYFMSLFTLAAAAPHRQEEPLEPKVRRPPTRQYVGPPLPPGRAPTLLARALRASPTLALEPHSGTRSVGSQQQGPERRGQPGHRVKTADEAWAWDARPLHHRRPAVSANQPTTSPGTGQRLRALPRLLYFSHASLPLHCPSENGVCPQGAHLLKHRGATGVCVGAGTGPGTRPGPCWPQAGLSHSMPAGRSPATSFSRVV